MLRSLSRVVGLHSGVSTAVGLHSNFSRSFMTSALSRLRKITVENPDEKTTVINCEYIESPRKPNLLKEDSRSQCESKKCPLCKLQLDLKHTDVLILSQYMDSEGNIFKFKDTDLCKDQYKLVSNLIYMAQYAGLLPEPPREEPRKPYLLLNTYYDERTIRLRPWRKKRHMRLYYLRQKLAPIERLRVKPDIGPYYGRQIH